MLRNHARYRDQLPFVGMVISDASGVEMHRVTLPKGALSIDLNCADFAPGMYLVMLIDNAGTQHHGKLIKL